MDGEKDPRNLLLAFSLVKIMIKEFDISQHVESLFDVTFCYFPITFKPPPDDPYGITADDLKIALRECLSATPLFAKSVIPQLLEKLTSTSGSAKKDSMETLAACAPVYGVDNIYPFTEELWEYLKEEILNAADDSIEVIALEAIRSIVATLSVGIIGRSDDHLQKFLKTAISECMENLKTPELKLSRPSGKILKYCAMASDPSYNLIILTTMHGLLDQYKSSDLTTRKKGLLEVFMEYIDAARHLYGSIEDPQDDRDDRNVDNPLAPYKDDLLGIFGPALLEVNEYSELRLCGLRGLYDMILLKQFLSDNEVGIILQHFNQIILNENDQDIVKKTVSSLGNIARHKTKIVLEVTLPTLVSQLPSDYETLNLANIHGIKYKRVLEAFSEVPIEPVLFEALVPKILTKLDGIHVSSSDLSIEYTGALLRSLHSLLIKKSSLNHNDISRYVNILVTHLIAKCVGPTLVIDDVSGKYVFCDLGIIKITAGIISIIIKNINVSEQKEFISQIFELFIQGNTNFLPFPEIEKNKHGIPFQPLSSESSSSQKNLTLLFTASVCYIRPEVPYPIPDISDFLSKMMITSLLSSNEEQQTSLAQLSASILNKWDREKELEIFVQNNVLRELASHFASGSSGNTSLYLYLWLTKALVLRTHPLGYDCVDQIMNLFEDPTLGKQASEGFGVIIGDNDVLSKTSFSIIKLLHKQRFFNYVMPKLVEGFKRSNNDNYLIALSHLLRNVPKQILLSELPPLFPLLIHSLSLPDPNLKVSTIDTFYLIALEAPHIISEHVSTIIPLILSLTQATDGNTMRVRMSSLQCLSVFPDTVSFDVLYPFKSRVLKDLGNALDDKKRSVRKEAVDCRSRWFLFTGSKPN